MFCVTLRLKNAKSAISLFLWCVHLFNEDTRDGLVSCVRVSDFRITTASSYPEAHANLALVDVQAVAFNVAVTVKVFVISPSPHVQDAFDSHGTATLYAVEGKIPAAAARVTVVNPQSAGKKHTQSRVTSLLDECTILCNEPKQNMKVNPVNYPAIHLNCYKLPCAWSHQTKLPYRLSLSDS